MSLPPIPAPPAKRKSRLVVDPASVSTPNNLDTRNENVETSGVDLNFKVPVAFHTQFKMVATSKRLAMKVLLRESFRAYCRENGIDVDMGW